MIETKDIFHTVRSFATRTGLFDFLKVVAYFSYRGDIKKVPFYFEKGLGHSAESDLTLSVDEILKAMNSTTRNEVRRAEKEGCAFELIHDVDEFIPFYNAFCESKGLNDFVDHARMKKFKHLLLAKSTHGGVPLAMHATLLDPTDHLAVLILSCSKRLDSGVDRKLIGWGNRFLHFKEMEYLKEQGFTRYDWSGVVIDPNSSLYSIGQFKLGFGGKLIESWTLKSPLYVLLEKFRNVAVRIRKFI